MSIFINSFSNNILYDFLNKFCNFECNYYILSNSIYKKNIFNDYIYVKEFVENIKDFYSKQKIFYTEREYTYKNILTIIRQICKYNNIPYRNIIKYNKNNYEIIYYIKIVN